MAEESVASSSRPATPVAELPNFASTSRQPLYRFNFDSPNRRPGPGSVADTVDSRADFNTPSGFYAQKYGNFSSATLQPGAIPPEWSASKYGLNAISTVLNNPNKKADPPKAHAPTRTIVPAVLPRIKRKDFESYLRAVGPEYERFEKNSLLGREGTADIDGSRSSRPGRQPPPLESVPQVYFNQPFEFGSPSTFSAIIEQKDNEPTLDPSALSHSLPLLEKMSHYADTIEQHLVREISVRSASFFEALSNLQDLQTESEQCLDRIGKLRGMLKELDEKGAKRGLEVVRLQRRLENLKLVREGVKTVESAAEMISVTRGLTGSGEWGEALTVIDGLQTAWGPAESGKLITAPRKTSPPTANGHAQLDAVKEEETSDDSPAMTSVQLSSLQAFSSLPTQLQSLSLQVSANLTNDLITTFQSDLYSRLEPSVYDVDGELGEKDQSLRIRLVPLMQELIRTGGLKNSVAALRGVCLEAVKAGVAKHISLPDLDDLDPEASTKGLDKQNAELLQSLRDKSPPEFLSLATAMYTTLLRCLEAVQTQNAIIVDIVRNESPGEVDLETEELEVEFSGVLSSATELANKRAAKILATRSEQHGAYDLQSFVTLFNGTWNFITACEAICRKMIVGLRGTIISQAKSFLIGLHNKRLAQSAKLVEEELWAPAEVLARPQTVVAMISDAAVHDPPELKLQTGDPAQSATADQQPQQNGVAKNPAASKVLMIEDKPFYVVSATLQVLELVLDYLRVIINLTLLTTETMSRTVEFLKAFNSRICQVVLGAGAMRSAGLKNITAKHLALASQSLSAMVSLIPYIRETFRRYLNPKQAVMLIEFDKLKRDYQEHQNEIHDKLISIMGDRLAFHCKSLAQINWSQMPANASSPPKVNEYMEQLLKEVGTLSKVLSKYLPQPTVEYIMSQVFAAINHRLEEEYGKIELPNERAKESLLVDTRYLRDTIPTLKGVGNISGMGMLEIVVGEKRLATATNGPKSPITSPVRSPVQSPEPPSSPVPKTTSPPPQQLNVQAPSLPSTIRRNPFAGNRRISNLLSSVTAIGKTDKPPVELPPQGLLPPEKEKVPERPPLLEPESFPISNSESGELASPPVVNAQLLADRTDSNPIPSEPAEPKQTEVAGIGQRPPNDNALPPPPPESPPTLPPKVEVGVSTPLAITTPDSEEKPSLPPPLRNPSAGASAGEEAPTISPVIFIAPERVMAADDAVAASASVIAVESGTDDSSISISRSGDPVRDPNEPS